MPPVLGVQRSFTGRQWVLPDVDEGVVLRLSHAAGISPLLARILTAHSSSVEDAVAYLNPSLKSLLPEPFTLKDMDVAIARVHRAIEAGENIAIFGDYDVDGSCSAALLHDFLAAIGRKPVVYIPDRLKEGYGPSADALLQLKASGIGLVITADCGANADTALGAARDAGLDVVVLDHHAVEHANEIAVAQVNPNQPGDVSARSYLCAAGVAFLFLVALHRRLREAGWYASHQVAMPDLRAGVDLVGLATVCDVVPLVGVNRAFVRGGLARISAAPRPGLKALAELAKAEGPFTPYHLGFVFGPRINAGGRVGRCSLGVELLTATNDADAMLLAKQLERHNRERQAIESMLLEEAIGQAKLQDNASFLFVAGEGWHAGVVGIIAGRLKDRFGKPALAIGFENGLGRGSARSVAGIDIGAVVRAAKESKLVEQGGGHAMAAGFSIVAEKFEPFREFVREQFATTGVAYGASNTLELQGVFSAAGATASLVAELERAGPFGAGNPEPVLAAPDMRVAFADPVGQGHVRMRLSGSDGTRLNAIAFRAVGTALGEGLLKSRGARIHVAGTLKSDRWNGAAQIQLHVQDAAAANG